MANQDDVFSLSCASISVGTSGGAFVGITCGAGVNSQILKYFSGGTVWVCGTTSQAATSATTGYCMGIGEAINIGGPAIYYLTSLGATSVVMLMKTITAGN